MALGSNSLFNNHFNIAYFLKVISVVVPFFGLLIDYYRAYQNLENKNEGNNNFADKLNLNNEKHILNIVKLERSNEELDQFESIISHNLNSPPRAITEYNSYIREDYEKDLDGEGIKHIDSLEIMKNYCSGIVIRPEESFNQK